MHADTGFAPTIGFAPSLGVSGALCPDVSVLVGDREPITTTILDDRLRADDLRGRTITRRPALHPDPEPRADLGIWLRQAAEIAGMLLSRPLAAVGGVGAMIVLSLLLKAVLAAPSGSPALP